MIVLGLKVMKNEKTFVGVVEYMAIEDMKVALVTCLCFLWIIHSETPTTTTSNTNPTSMIRSFKDRQTQQGSHGLVTEAWDHIISRVDRLYPNFHISRAANGRIH